MGVSEPTDPAAPEATPEADPPLAVPEPQAAQADPAALAASMAGATTSQEHAFPDVPVEPLPPAPEASPLQPASPVRVDNMTRRSDNDALEGMFCQVVSGPYAGRWGTFDHVVESDPRSGYPTLIMVISRDERNEMLQVAYSDARPTTSLGGR